MPVTILSGSKYTEHAPYYDIAANYASSTDIVTVSAVANTAAVALMKEFVSSTITKFKTNGNFANLTSHDIVMMGFDKGRKESLQITYLIGSSAHTLSYIFTITEDTLGAHPNLFFKTFSFDTDPSTHSGQAGAPLALTDLFVPGSEYLAALSRIARTKLPAVIGTKLVDADFIKNFIMPGTTPEEKNFDNFFFDNQDFVILFAPYAVAPYSAGPQTLRIPLTDLSDILKPAYR